MAIAGVAFVVVIGALLLIKPVGSSDEAVAVLPNSTSATTAQPPDPAAVAPASDAPTRRADAPPSTPDVPEATGGSAPTLDVIRIDGTGAAVVAGSGASGSDVILRLDGEEVAAATTDADGNFVSLFDIGEVQAPRILTIESRDAQGDVTQAAESIIVAPTFPAQPAAGTAPDVAQSVGNDDKDTAVALTQTVPSVSPTEDPQEVTQAAAQAAPPNVAPRVPSALADIGPAVTADIDQADPVTVAAGPAQTTAPRLFRAGREGLSVIATPTTEPQVRQDLGIDAISYDAAGAVSLAGTGARDAELRIYLDNQPVQFTQVDQAGAWSSPLPNVESGIYVLRIDAVAEDGTVESRVETPFQLTAPEIAAASRRDGVTAITVQPGFTLWAISEGYFGEGVQYVQIFESNRDQIRDPDLIFPGQVFNLPGVD